MELEKHYVDRSGWLRASVIRICIWGTVAMFISALIGHIFGVNIH